METEKRPAKRCPAYRGSETYAFVSYSHRDDARVLAVIDELYRQKYRIWYDARIRTGVDWSQEIGERLAGSSLVLLFLSKEFVRSQPCEQELTYAISKKRRIVCVVLEELDGREIPHSIGMQVSRLKRINAIGLTAREIAEKLTSPDAEIEDYELPVSPPEEEGAEPSQAPAAVLDRDFVGDGVTGYKDEEAVRRRHIDPWRAASIVLVTLLLAAVILSAGYIRGWFGVGVHSDREVFSTADGTEEQFTVTTWSDPVTRDLMLRAANDTAVYLCGNTVVDLASAIRYDGGWRVGDQRVENGGLTDLSALAGKRITHLAVVDQRLTTAGEPAKFPDLIYLDLSGNEIEDLSPLKGLTRLEVLKIQHISARDLSVLAEMPSLKYVYISPEMCPYIGSALDGSFELIVRK